MALSLLVDPRPSSPLLRNEHGQPVWPASGPAHAALRQTALLFSAATIATTGRPVDDLAEDGPEDVVALGDGFVASEARLYAHLTLRRFRSVRNVGELFQRDRPTVLVTRPEQVTHQLLDFLYDRDHDGPAPGILFADNEAALRRQVLVRSAAALLNGSVPVRRISFIAPADFDVQSIPGYELIGGRAGDDVVLTALGRGAGVLSVSTHSDGIDSFITPRLTLCPFDRFPGRGDPDRRPVCQITGFCHRSDVSVPQARADGRLLGTDAISARVLIWNVCNGIIASSGSLGRVIDGAWGLMPRLLESSRIGSVLTTWYQTMSSPLQVEPLSASIASGTSLGAALAEFLRSPHAGESGIRLCLLGDPRTALPTTPSEPIYTMELPARQRRRIPAPAAPDERLADANFLHAWLALVTQNHRGGAAEDSARHAADAVASYTDAVRGEAEGNLNVDHAGVAMRNSVTSHLGQFGSLASRTWLRAVEQPTLISPPRACFGCGLLTNTYAAYAKSGDFGPRRVGICPGCGIVEDVPLGTEVAIRVDEALQVRLRGLGATPAWTCRAVAESMGPRNHASWEWPADHSGGPTAVFQLPGPFPPGPLRIVVIFMSEARIFILQQPGRAPGVPVGDTAAGR